MVREAERTSEEGRAGKDEKASAGEKPQVPFIANRFEMVESVEVP